MFVARNSNRTRARDFVRVFCYLFLYEKRILRICRQLLQRKVYARAKIMADKNKEEPRTFIAGKQSVDMALELLRLSSKSSGKRKRKENLDNGEKMSSHCHENLLEKKGTSVGQVFAKSHAITEMRTCLARRDWASLRELFLVTLGGTKTDSEPIIWRYALTLLLASPYSDTACFQEFLEMCIGVQSFEDSYLLEKLLTLKNPQND